MEKVSVEKLKKSVPNYSLTQDLLNKILENIEKSIIENGNLITEANKEDVKINKKQIKIKKLLEIVNSYKNKKSTNNSKNKKVIIYRGDPYLTLHISLQALLNHSKTILVCDEFMLGVNNVLIKILLSIFKKNNIENLVTYITDYDSEFINDLYEICDNIIVIGNTAIYQKLKQENKQCKFYPYNNIVLYCDSNDLLKLQDAIYIYANENQFEIEILNVKSLQDVINIVQLDKYINTVVLLTKSNSHKEIIEKSVSNVDIYVNDNPFKQEVGRVYNYFE